MFEINIGHPNLKSERSKSVSDLQVRNPHFGRAERFPDENHKNVMSRMPRTINLNIKPPVEEDNEKVNKMLLDAIKAKIALLNSLND